MVALKLDPPRGMRPSLENHRLDDLQIDAEYQRSIDNGASQALIRRIAAKWDWSLFQPLAVARRPEGLLFVVDGQHRLAAARLREDLHDLPCVVSPYACSADEAASFVAMNAQRKPLNALDLFKAGLAAGDPEAIKIMALIAAAGLTLAPHSNASAWKPGMVSNIAGIRQCYRSLGRDPTSAALACLASAFPEQILQYAGSLFLGLAKAYAKLLVDDAFDPDLFIDIVNGATQRTWFDDILAERAAGAGNMALAGEAVFLRAYAEATTDDDQAAA